jgi:hypothetical protein
LLQGPLTLLLASICALAGLACAAEGTSTPPAPEVVRAPIDCERLEYALVQDGRTYGVGSLTSTAFPTPDPIPSGVDDIDLRSWLLKQEFTSTEHDGFMEGSSVEVFSDFTPSVSDWYREDPQQRTHRVAEYESAEPNDLVVSFGDFVTDAGGSRMRDPQELRLRPNAYDNESSFWLWRALPLAEGYRARYTSVNVAERNQVTIDLTVVGAADVTVPAGTIEAWRVLVVSGRATRTAWVEVAAPHRLVQWDNGATLMQLTGASRAECR